MIKIILLVIFLFVFLILFLPSSINISLHFRSNRYFLDTEKINDLKNEIVIKLFSLIPVYRKKIFDKTKRKEKNKTKKSNSLAKTFKKKKTIYALLNKSYFEKFALNLGFNIEDPIANSYINASLNTLICMYINLNSNNFNFNKLYYETHIGDDLLNLNFECIIKLTLADTIVVIANEYKKLKKHEKNSMYMFKKGENYGRASN